MDKCYKLHGFPPIFKFKNNKNAIAHQVSFNLELIQGNALAGVTDFASSMAASQAPAFTHDQYQRLLTLIGSCSTQQPPKGQELHVANTVACPSNVVAGNSINFKHSVLSAKIVNRRAYDLHTWVIDTGASDHIVCSIQLLTSYTEISHTIVELPNGEAAIVTHIGTIQPSSHITLTIVLCVPSFTFNLLSVSALTKSQPICLVFLSKFYFLQDLTCWSTIGMGKCMMVYTCCKIQAFLKLLHLFLISFPSRISSLSLLLALLLFPQMCFHFGIQGLAPP